MNLAGGDGEVEGFAGFYLGAAGEARDEGRPRWRTVAELPPVGERLQSTYDPVMHYSTKRQLEWLGYKVHITETRDDDAAHLITHVNGDHAYPMIALFVRQH